LIGVVAILGSMVASKINIGPASPFQGFGELPGNVMASLGRLVYLALIQTVIPAAILRGLVRRDVQRVTVANSALFGAILGLGYAVFITSLFWIASLIQPGSVAPGYILTWQNMYGALTLGLAAWAGVLLGKVLRRNNEPG
jgi:apolipoprotein N-acyltransferase